MMGILDRLWWLRLVAAPAFLLLIPFVLYWYVRYAVPYDLHHHPVALADAILASFAVFGPIALAVHAVLAARMSLQRNAQRAEVLASNPDAIPSAMSAAVTITVGTPAIFDTSAVRFLRHISATLLNCLVYAGAFVFCADTVLSVVCRRSVSRCRLSVRRQHFLRLIRYNIPH